MAASIVFVFGLLIGSFLNVCIYRIPKNISIVFPNSHCPKCKKEIKWYDNIPVLSYLLLLGKCRNCKTKISPRYLIVELITAILFVSGFYRFGLSREFISILVFISVITIFSFLIVIALIDLKTQYIYDVTVIPLAIFGICVSVLIPGRGPLLALAGYLAGGAVFLLIAIFSLAVYKQEGMGMGDVKLAAATGTFLGLQGVLIMSLLSVILGSIISSYLLLSGRKHRMDPIPFGPFIVLGTFIVMLAGDKIILAGYYFQNFIIKN